jgi:uncharacterized repeat protein (TIGR01451 family)
MDVGQRAQVTWGGQHARVLRADGAWLAKVIASLQRHPQLHPGRHRRARPGGRPDYTITVTDNGPSALTSATVTATLPSPMTATSSWIRVPVRGPDPDLPSVAVRAVVGARWSVLVAGHSVGSGPVASA